MGTAGVTEWVVAVGVHSPTTMYLCIIQNSSSWPVPGAVDKFGGWQMDMSPGRVAQDFDGLIGSAALLRMSEGAWAPMKIWVLSWR